VAVIAGWVVVVLLLVGWWFLVHPDDAGSRTHGSCNTELYTCASK